VASTIGEGTIFTVTLPKAHPAAAGRVRDGAPRVEESLSILAIDDMDAVLTVLKRGLEQHGHTVSTALSGEAGIRLFKEVRVDVVICDLAMPEENGWEVARAVRQICHEHGLQNVSFIILTGWGDQLGPKATLAGTGVDAVVEKPVDLEALLHAINAARRR
jgi:CheY-like chemotaxis protein